MNQEGPHVEMLLGFLHRVPRAPEEVIEGASVGELAALRQVLGEEIPLQLKEWLQVCNGTTAGPGGIFGTGTDREYLNIEFYIEIYPVWRELDWIPVGGDGTGNYYILATGRHEVGFHAVFFVDMMDNWLHPSYCVASDLFHFLQFLMESELGARGWPFDRKYVESRDPNISASTMLPWA